MPQTIEYMFSQHPSTSLFFSVFCRSIRAAYRSGLYLIKTANRVNMFSLFSLPLLSQGSSQVVPNTITAAGSKATLMLIIVQNLV